MSDIDEPKPEEVEIERALLDAYRQRWQAKGFNLDEGLISWAKEEAKALETWCARADFDELCTHGCAPEILAALIASFRFCPNLENFWTEMVGHPDHRQKTTKTLENAAVALETLFGRFIESEDEHQRTEFIKLGRLPISSVVSELRFYIKFITFAERFSVCTESTSLAEICKYIFAGYVKRSTGRFHDRNVSALIAVLTDSQGFDEVAHRMWRSRNYKRLDKNFSWIAALLVAMNVAKRQPA
jgi:hypothetical protein